MAPKLVTAQSPNILPSVPGTLFEVPRSRRRALWQERHYNARIEALAMAILQVAPLAGKQVLPLVEDEDFRSLQPLRNRDLARFALFAEARQQG